MRQHDFEDFSDDHEYSSRKPRRKRRFDDEPEPTRGGRLTEAERVRLALLREDAYAEPEIPGGGDRWSTWDRGTHGPEPRPHWLVTELAAVDTDLGVLKTGKEADVHLVRRGVPGGRQCLLTAKRYRSDEHRLFHRDAGYLEGRRLRRSREMRAIETRTAFGRNLIAEQWAAAEFDALGRLWEAGLPVPYPVQRDGTELLMEFLGDDDGTAAARLAQLRPGPGELRELWGQLISAMELLAADGLAHGDLSAYNLLVHQGRLMLIDLPQVVDVVTNTRGVEYLTRDALTVASWFEQRGLPGYVIDSEKLIERLLAVALR